MGDRYVQNFVHAVNKLRDTRKISKANWGILVNKLKDTCDQIQDTGEQIQGYRWPIYDSWLYTCSELKDTGEQIERYLWTHWEILVKDTLEQFKRHQWINKNIPQKDSMCKCLFNFQWLILWWKYTWLVILSPSCSSGKSAAALTPVTGSTEQLAGLVLINQAIRAAAAIQLTIVQGVH